MATPLPRTFWYLFAGTLVNRVGAFVMPFLTLYLTRQRGFSVAQAGTIVSLFGAGSLAAGFLGGQLADRVGRRATMLGSLVGGAAVLLALSQARAPGAIAALAFLLGLVADSYRPAVFAMVADLVPQEQRLRAYGYLYWAVNLGFSIAPVVAGLLARRSYLALFVGDAATTLAFAALLYARVPETRPAITGDTPPRRALPLRTDPVFAAFVGLAFVVGLLYQQANVALPVDMARHGLDEGVFGVVIALNGVLIVLVQPWATRAVARLAPWRVLAASAFLVGAGFGLNALARAAPMYAVAVAVWTLGEIAGSPTTSAVVAHVAPIDQRGAYQGSLQMGHGAAVLIGPLLGGLLIEGASPRVLWLACAIAGAAVAAGHLVLGRHLRGRLER